MGDNNKQLIQKLFQDVAVNHLPDTGTHRLRMTIEGSTGNEYVVSQRMKKDGTTQFECGCQGWIYHRKCKHLTAMRPALQQAAALLDGAHPRKTVVPTIAAKPATKALPKAAPAKAAPKAAPKKSGVKALEGLTIEHAEGGKAGLTLTMSDGSVLEISSVYEGGIEISLEQEEEIKETKKVRKNIA